MTTTIILMRTASSSFQDCWNTEGLKSSVIRMCFFEVKNRIIIGVDLSTNTDRSHSHGAAPLNPPPAPILRNITSGSAQKTRGGDMQCLSTFPAARWGGGELAEADSWRQADGCVDRPGTECTLVQCRRYLRSDGCGIWVPDIFSA